MNVIVCGGRDYSDRDKVEAALDELHERHDFNRIITGAAPGADTFADAWARSRGLKVERYFADWYNLGKAAGPLRNQRMLDAEKPQMVIAFPGGTGTADMVRRAEAAGVPIHRVE